MFTLLKFFKSYIILKIKTFMYMHYFFIINIMKCINIPSTIVLYLESPNLSLWSAFICQFFLFLLQSILYVSKNIATRRIGNIVWFNTHVILIPRQPRLSRYFGESVITFHRVTVTDFSFFSSAFISVFALLAFVSFYRRAMHITLVLFPLSPFRRFGLCLTRTADSLPLANSSRE